MMLSENLGEPRGHETSESPRRARDRHTNKQSLYSKEVCIVEERGERGRGRERDRDTVTCFLRERAEREWEWAELVS